MFFEAKRPSFDRVIQHLLIGLHFTDFAYKPCNTLLMVLAFLMQTGPKKSGKI
jgi:hypothetical protein